MFVDMKNITFSADESLIELARRRAAAAHLSLNEVFRAWLERYVNEPAAGERYDELMSRLTHVRSGSTFSRDEMNER